MKTTLKSIIAMLLVFTFSTANASSVKDCGWLTIVDMTVIAEHALPEHEGHYLVIRPGEDRGWQCQDYDFFYLSVSDPAFNAIFSMAKDALNNGKKARIGVHGSQGIYNGYQKIMFLNI